MPKYVWFWLIPAAEDRALFQSVINALAKVHDAPVFTPHVTLYGGVYTDADNPTTMVNQATQGLAPMRLDVDHVRYSEAFTKTLFVQFRPSPAANDLSAALRATAASPSDYVLDPHLSLIYKHMPEAEKGTIASAIKLPRAVVHFDEVWAVLAPDHLRREEDVGRWDIVCRKSLEGS